MDITVSGRKTTVTDAAPSPAATHRAVSEVPPLPRITTVFPEKKMPARAAIAEKPA